MISAINIYQPSFSDKGIYVDIGPVTVFVEMPARDSRDVVESCLNQIFTELAVSENSIRLLGFSDPGRRDLYQRLCRVSGIGPAAAFLALELGEKDDILRAASSKDLDFFKQMPGIGSLRAEKIVIGLRKNFQGLPKPTTIRIWDWVAARDRVAGNRVERERCDMLLPKIIDNLDEPGVDQLVDALHDCLSD